ncbi:MAG: FHA domain-containing protein [Chloroflexi bacterium]|nr:FHA domain-containing protein [Chloroflexota bacterium]
MPNPFETGNLAWLWYESWLAVVAGGFAVAMLIHARLTIKRGRFQKPIQIVLAFALVATLPMALVRLGVNLGGWQDSMAVLSFIGAGGAAIYGAFSMRAIRLVRWVNKRIAERQETAARVRESRSIGEATGGATGTGSTGAAAGSGTGATPAVSAWIRFQSGPASGQSLPISTGITRIGRDHSNDIVVDDPNVSRNHSEIEYKNGQFFLRDSGSSGGTLLSGQKLSNERVLESGSSILMGGTELVFTAAEPVTQFTSGSAGTVVSGIGDIAVRSTTVDAMRPAETMLGNADQDDDRLSAWLTVTSGPHKGQICQLSVDRTTIGRDGSNEMVVNDPAVSRSHAVVIAREDNLVLVDLGSSGGTKVNGRPVAGKSVKNGALLRVGDTDIELVSVSTTSPHSGSANENDRTVLDSPASTGVAVVRSGPDAGQTLNLEEGDNVIGRDPASAIELRDPTVSRRHAVIRSQPGGYVVYDLASRTGTYVDGMKMAGARLKTGDRIAVGHTELSLMRPHAA